VEFRIDHLRSPDIEKIRKHLTRFAHRSILTVRRSSEGGGFKGKEEERLTLIRRLADLNPAFLDVELRTLETVNNLSTNDIGNNVIVSWHDQHKTPGRRRLLSIMAKAASYGGLVKIVTTAKTASDNLAVLSLYDEPGPPPIAFCMGAPGIFSRVMAMEKRIPIAFGSLPGEPTAPGQLSVTHLIALRRSLEDG
jgi:3-dehydroquinate dehydratase type I